MDSNTAIIRYQNWIDIYREWANSGMSKKDFCRERNIREKQFYYYQRQIRNIAAESAGLPSTKNESRPEIVKMTVGTEEISPMIQLRLNGVEMCLPENVPTSFLSKLLEAAGHGTR